MTSVRARAAVLTATGAAGALASLLTLTAAGSAAGPQALDQRIDEQIDLGLACLHLGARIAIPEQSGDAMELALKQASLGPAPCS